MINFNGFWNKLKNRWFHAISSQQLTLLGRSVCVTMKKLFKPSDGSIHRKIRAALALLGSAVRESRQKGSAQIALLAGGRAGERWCSSTLADTRENAFVSFVWSAREKQSRWAPYPWQRHLALVSSGLSILGNFWHVTVWYPVVKLSFAPDFRVTLVKCFRHQPLLPFLFCFFLVSKNVNFLHFWPQEKIAIPQLGVCGWVPVFIWDPTDFTQLLFNSWCSVMHASFQDCSLS